MTTTQSRMFEEAAGIPALLAAQRRGNAAAVAALAARLRNAPPSFAVTCARGSSAHAATYARTLMALRLRLLTAAQPLSVLSVYGVAPRAEASVCLAISQSGASPDIVAATAALGRAGALTIAMVNDEASLLAEAAAALVPLRAGPERSVAATKSFLAAMFAAADLVAAWSEDAALERGLDLVPDLLDRAWRSDWSPLVERLARADRLFLIGRGYGLAAAREAALKLKETCGLHAEAFSAAEFRHGPLALVRQGAPVLIFRQPDATADGIDGLARDLLAIGATVLIAGGSQAGAIELPTPEAAAEFMPMVQIQSFYRAACGLAAARGYDADRPAHLSKITETV